MCRGFLRFGLNIFMSDAVLLTATQQADVRRHLGYGNYGSDDDTLGSYYRMTHLEKLQYKMDHLSASDYAFVNTQLKAINAAYLAWVATANNLTAEKVAAVSINLRAPAQKRRIYDQLCQDLAEWIAVPFLRGNRGQLRSVI